MERYSIPDLLLEIGRRVQRERLNQNLSQAELCRKAGISRKTMTNLENGEPCSLVTLLAVLQGLKRVEHLDAFLPDPGISPVELAKLHGKVRKRATGKRKLKGRKKFTYTSSRPSITTVVGEPSEVWNWADED